MDEPAAFDVAAAWVRRAAADAPACMAALAARLEGSMPGRVEIGRAREGLFSARTHVARIGVTFDHARYELTERHGHVAGRRSKIVRDVVISSQDLPIPAWLEALAADIRALGAVEGAATDVLHDFLVG